MNGEAQPIPAELGNVGNCQFRDGGAHTFADAIAIGFYNAGRDHHFISWDPSAKKWVVDPDNDWQDDNDVWHANEHVRHVCEEVQ
jgi:hypothetical protein